MGPPSRPVTPLPAIQTRIAIDAFKPRRPDPRADHRGVISYGRRSRVPQELLDRRDHRGRLLGRGVVPVQFQAWPPVHGWSRLPGVFMIDIPEPEGRPSFGRLV